MGSEGGLQRCAGAIGRGLPPKVSPQEYPYAPLLFAILIFHVVRVGKWGNRMHNGTVDQSPTLTFWSLQQRI
jgi:hypothetical protein